MSGHGQFMDFHHDFIAKTHKNAKFRTHVSVITWNIP